MDARLVDDEVTAGDVARIEIAGGGAVARARLVVHERRGVHRATGIDPDPVELASAASASGVIELEVPRHLPPAGHVPGSFGGAGHDWSYEVEVERGRDRAEFPIHLRAATLGDDPERFSPNLRDFGGRAPNTPSPVSIGTRLIVLLAAVVAISLCGYAVFSGGDVGGRAAAATLGFLALGIAALGLPTAFGRDDAVASTLMTVCPTIDQRVVEAGSDFAVEIDPGAHPIGQLSVRLVAEGGRLGTGDGRSSSALQALYESEDIAAASRTLVPTPTDGPVAYPGRDVWIAWRIEVRDERWGSIRWFSVDVRPAA